MLWLLEAIRVAGWVSVHLNMNSELFGGLLPLFRFLVLSCRGAH